MQVPKPTSIPLKFFFTKNDIKSNSLPSVLEKLEVEKWNDLENLVEIHHNFKKNLDVKKSLKKGVKDFEAVEIKYIKNVSVFTFAGKIADYLETCHAEAEYQ